MFNFNQTDILSGRRVLVIGFARQGQALARWLPTIGARPVVTDTKTAEELGISIDDFPRVSFVLGGNPETLLDDADLVCISGGVPLTNPLVQSAIQRGIAVTNDAQLFVDRCPAPIIGITGSAGKTTTTTLVGEMMKAAGYTTWVGGNIGNVLLDVMMGIRAEHQVVMELSSFQLEMMFTSPPIGAILNVTPNHLDRHGTMENYLRAKANIIAHQDREGMAILGHDDAMCRLLEGAVRGDALWFSRHDMVSDGAFLAGSRLIVTGHASQPSDGSPQIVCEVSDIPLRGDHNVSNVLAACAIAGAAGVSHEVMGETIRNFKAVPHRLEKIREVNGVTYVNDSIATAPERVVAALLSYNEPIVLLLGGADKKLPWSDLLRLALGRTRSIIAFGRDGDIVVEAAKQLTGSSSAVTRVETLEQAVTEAVKVAQDGDVVLLSPGMTSYDAYADFVARGDHFRQLVMSL